MTDDTCSKIKGVENVKSDEHNVLNLLRPAFLPVDRHMVKTPTVYITSIMSITFIEAGWCRSIINHLVSHCFYQLSLLQ